MGPFEALFSGVVAFEPVFLRDNMSQKGGVGHPLASGRLEILLPMGGQAVEPEVTEFFLQGFIHNGRGRVGRSGNLLDKRAGRGRTRRWEASAAHRSRPGTASGRSARGWPGW